MKIVLILSSVLLNCLAQLLIKKGMIQVGEISIIQFTDNFIKIVTNIWLWFAIVSLGLSLLLWVIVLSKVDVSYAYPFTSLGFVFLLILGKLCFNETISLLKITGIIVIIIGVLIISKA